MKRRSISTTEQNDEHFKRLCDELGEDTIKKLHRAFTLTAAAVYRRAEQHAQAQLRKQQTKRQKSLENPL
ncbi:MAG TPA: hypothetical protein VG456_23875 [Candidatus Sulfopaludibacter sp.]|nr:hypothetical protein [Candidatus Sulfopaludibacter sp.]